MAVEFNGSPFQYNPAVTNVNIDNQLAGILGQFNDDYILDVVNDSLKNRFNAYQSANPNVISAYEATFRHLTDGFSSSTDDILNTRNRTYTNIINVICNFYNLQFNPHDDTDYYSAAYWLYDFFVSNFTEHLKTFYAMHLIQERKSISEAFNLPQMRKDNDIVFGYSKKLFKNSTIAAIHCNIDYIISQMDSFNISLETILFTVYGNIPNLPAYVASIVSDHTGYFFKNYYQNFVLRSPDAADMITYVKLALQEIGRDIEND